MKCFISRRSRDAAWIFGKECMYASRDPLAEGAHVTQRGHTCTMQMDVLSLSVSMS